ncbi:MAG: response regulator [Treponema sp.]|nr:response regulator [Treponema sp.]
MNMKVLAIDDSERALKLLTNSIAEAQPSAQIFAFTKPSELLAFAKENSCDIAFLDIQMWGMNGLEVAKELKELNPRINIIFVTAYSKHACEAFELYPSGFILKPVMKEAVEREIENLRHPIDQKKNSLIYAQTFGNFEIYSYGTPMKFSYSKTKELIAYLIDRNGASACINELCAVLWENEEDTENLKAYLRKLISDLYKALREIGAEDILIKQHKNIAIVPDKIVCDIYGFMKGNPACINAYRGQYMNQYSWAEAPKWKLNESK